MRRSGVLAAALLVLLGAARASAIGPPNRWESFGPFPYVQIPLGTVADSALAIAVDPTDPQTIYAGYNAGVYKTADGGATWTVVFTDFIGGFPPNARPILALSLDRGDPSTVFAVTSDSIQRTRNAGLTWQPVLVSEGVSAISPVLDGAAVFAARRQRQRRSRQSAQRRSRGHLDRNAGSRGEGRESLRRRFFGSANHFGGRFGGPGGIGGLPIDRRRSHMVAPGNGHPIDANPGPRHRSRGRHSLRRDDGRRRLPDLR